MPTFTQHPTNPLQYEAQFSSQIRLVFDTDTHTLWYYCQFANGQRPCYSMGLLLELLELGQNVKDNTVVIDIDGQNYPIKYAVQASDHPTAYNLGGDLAWFTTLIEAQDQATLSSYAHLCIKNWYNLYAGVGEGFTSISLVKGDCLGGGFENALAGDVIVAEEQAKFGFPESLFNLFPGMGAPSVLYRRLGKRKAEELLTNGQLYTAAEMLELGLIDKVVPQGTGDEAVRELIKIRSAKANTFGALPQFKRIIEAIPEAELYAITDLWTQRALQLGPRDLRFMKMVVAKQNKL